VKNARERETNPDKIPMNLGLMLSLEKENAHFEKIIEEIDKKYLNLRLLIEDDKRWIDFVAEWISLNVEQNSIQELEWLSTRLNFITEENTTSAVSTKIKQLHYLYVQTESTIPEFDMVFCKDINPDSFENIPYEIRNLSFELKSALTGIVAIYEVYGKTIERKAEVHFNLLITLAKRYVSLVKELNGRLKNPLKPKSKKKSKSARSWRSPRASPRNPLSPCRSSSSAPPISSKRPSTTKAPSPASPPASIGSII
jgi:hypothetical protein